MLQIVEGEYVVYAQYESGDPLDYGMVAKCGGDVIVTTERFIEFFVKGPKEFELLCYYGGEYISIEKISDHEIKVKQYE